MIQQVQSERVRNLKTYLFTRFKKEGASAAGRIDLSIGDPDVGVRREILNEALRFAGKIKEANRYPSGRGLIELRRAVAHWMDFRFGVKLDPETEIAILAGSKEGLAHLALALLNSGDTALVGSLAYPVYERACSLAGARVQFLPMPEENGYLLDWSGQRGKVIFANYPNNPTGASAPPEFWRELIAWAAKRRIWVVSDAAYADVYFDDKKAPSSALSIAGAKEITVEFHSFSKSFGLAGLRLGWVCGNASIISALLRLKDTYDSGVSHYVQGVGLYLLTFKGRDREMARLRSLYGARRAFFEKGLSSCGIPFLSSCATFYVWTGRLDSSWLQRFAKLNIEAVEGEGFGEAGASRLRFALCNTQARIREALKRMKRG